MNPLVSIVIPTRNREHLLKRAVNSVLNQTFTNYEIIIIDDFSDNQVTDNKGLIKYEKIKIIRHSEQKGGSAARNTGIRNASGDFIAFLDDDDEWMPPKLEQQVQLFKNSKKNTALIYTGVKVIDENNSNYVKVMVPSIRGEKTFEKLLEKNYLGTTSSIMVKKTAIEDVGFFDESLPARQDLDLYLRIAKLYSIDFIEEPLVIHRKHKENRISDNLHSKIKGFEILYEKLKPELKNHPELESKYLMKYGQLLMANNDSSSARVHFKKSVKLKPRNLKAFLLYLISYLGSSNYIRIKNMKNSISSYNR